MIHLHTDNIREAACYFKDKLGNGMRSDPRMFGFIMQGANIVYIVYSQAEAEEILNQYKGEKIDPIYFFNEEKLKK